MKKKYKEKTPKKVYLNKIPKPIIPKQCAFFFCHAFVIMLCCKYEKQKYLGIFYKKKQIELFYQIYTKEKL